MLLEFRFLPFLFVELSASLFFPSSFFLGFALSFLFFFSGSPFTLRRFFRFAFLTLLCLFGFLFTRSFFFRLSVEPLALSALFNFFLLTLFDGLLPSCPLLALAVRLFFFLERSLSP